MIRGAFILMLAFSPLAFAPAEAAAPVAVSEGDFTKQRAEIEKQLSDGKTYSEIAGGDRARVREALVRMGDMMSGVASVEDLDAQQRARLFNDQEVVNTILTQAAADSRLVCEHRTPTGSRMKVTTCETVAERERRKQNDQNELQKLQRVVAPVRN